MFALFAINIFVALTSLVGFGILYWGVVLYTRDQLSDAGVSIILYPLSAFRAMSKAALSVYKTIANMGSQSEVVNLMQTRDELYETLNYHAYETKLDKLFSDTDVD